MEYRSLSLMVRTQKRGTSARKSARLEKNRGKVLVHNLLDTNLGSKIHSASGSEEEQVVVTQLERSTTSPSRISDSDVRNERSPTLDFIEEVMFRFDREESSSINMPTCLKYSRFQGDGSQDVDDWFSKFESIALANQEDLEAKQRIF